MSAGSSASTITAVVTVFNGLPYLGPALDSIFGQTRPPDEVLVVDDGSTDGSGDFVKANYPGARVIRQENQGISRARNAGLAAATGDYVALCDADDIWLPWKLEVEMSVLARLAQGSDAVDGPALLGSAPILLQDRAVARATASLAARHPRGVPTFQRLGFAEMLTRDPFGVSGVIARRDLLAAVGGFDPATDGAEDWDAWLRIAARSPVYLLTRPRTHIYRLRPGNASSSAVFITKGHQAVLRRWRPGRDSHVTPRVYRRACSRNVLKCAFRYGRARAACPPGLLDEFPLDGPLESGYGLTLWCCRKIPWLFYTACAGRTWSKLARLKLAALAAGGLRPRRRGRREGGADGGD